jgi:hypothetical protein
MDTAQLTTMIATMTGRPEDPAVKGFAQLLASALRDDNDDVEDRAARRARRRRVAMQRVAHIQRLIQNMSDRNMFVAGALGACDCWGADAGCERCGGRGAPGTFDPDPAALELLVLPLLRRRPHLFHALPMDARVEALTRDIEPGGGSYGGEPH